MSESGTGDLDARIARLEQQDQRLAQALEALAQRDAAPAKAHRKWDAYAALIAAFIGVLALAISGYTAYVQRQQLRAQIWPRLQIGSSSINLYFSVSNQGTGPARVTAMRVAVDGIPVTDWDDAQKKAGFADHKHLQRSSFSTAVLPAGKDFILVQSDDSEQGRTKVQQLLPGHKHAITITICYCSVLDDCWVAMMGFLPAVRHYASNDCPITPDEQFHE